MNKQEISEIKKQFTPDNHNIGRICGCYVDYNKDKKFTFKHAFMSIPEDDTFKYFDIFKSTLSGVIGKSLINIEFPMSSEQVGGCQEFLYTLRNSNLEDDDLIEQFYDKIIEAHVTPENYLILLAKCTYDIPGVTKDNLELDDASEDVYEYLVCSICPVVLSKAGLGINEENNSVESRYRDWIVDNPVTGFLFPAFNDRNTDIHNALYFTKKPADLSPEFIMGVFGAYSPMSAPDQVESFRNLIEETIGKETDYKTIKSIHENLMDMIEEHKFDETPLELGKEEVKTLFENSGVSKENIESFEESYVTAIGDEDYPLLAQNIKGPAKFGIQTPYVVIKVKPDRTDLIETRRLDDRQYLVIEVDDHIEVNGVNAWTLLD